jgi:SOS-response transcriptional repressor LexA
MTAPLTRKQKLVLDAFRAYEKEFGCSATIREIGENLDMGKVAVYEHVRALGLKGMMIQTKPNAAWITTSMCYACGQQIKGA